MKKRRQVQAFNGEFQLPEHLIHRIQSFLTAKEAARTAILSKSWLSAWSTRPNLDLELDNFVGDDGDSKFDEFSELAKKTIQSYEQSNLKIESLSLRLCIDNPWVVVNSGDFAKDLITRALKIGATHLSLHFSSWAVVLPQVVFEAENLVGLSVDGCTIHGLGCDRKVRCSKLESLCLGSVRINSDMISNIASCCPLIEKLSLCNVYSLNYDDDHVYYSFLSDLSSRFPSLKDLTLTGGEIGEVSSHSLEQLNFATWHSRLSVKFDVPSIRKFRFEGVEIPSVSFVSAPKEWESDVIISVCDGSLSTLWFRRLNKFLTELGLSRIYLSVKINNRKICIYEVGDIRGLSKPKVENLLIDMMFPHPLSCFALIHGLFQICRPKFISVHYRTSWQASRNDLLCKTLARGLDDKCMYGLHDLEDVNVSLFDKDVNVWRPLSLKSFLDPSISKKGIQKIRFHMKWKT